MDAGRRQRLIRRRMNRSGSQQDDFAVPFRITATEAPCSRQASTSWA